MDINTTTKYEHIEIPEIEDNVWVTTCLINVYDPFKYFTILIIFMTNLSGLLLVSCGKIMSVFKCCQWRICCIVEIRNIFVWTVIQLQPCCQFF